MRVPAPNRFVTLAVAFALVAPPLIEARHAARTTHIACPIDGRIEDAATAPAEAPHSHAVRTLLDGNGDPVQHAHRACEAVPAARARARPASPATSGIARVLVAVAVSPPHDPPRAAVVAVYQVAPKLSPPL